MHRYKIVPPILLILSLINVLLAAPVVLQEVRQGCVDMADVPEDVIPVSQSEKRSDGLEKRWDEYSDEPYQKRGSSPGSSPAPSVPVGGPPANQEPDLASNEGGPGSSMNSPPSNRPEIELTRPAVPEPFRWSLDDWSDSSSVAEPKNNFMSKTKNFFDKLVSKCKFWRRGPGVL